jgi:hypothetical protein
MKIVYATGIPRAFEFAIAPAWGALPPEAIVFAICEGEHCHEPWDEYLFQSMSDEEFYTLRGMIRIVVQLEAQAFTRATFNFAGWLRGVRNRFFRWRPLLPSER